MMEVQAKQGQWFWSFEREIPGVPQMDHLYVIDPDWGARSPRRIFYDMQDGEYHIEFHDVCEEDITKAHYEQEKLEPVWSSK